MDCFECAHADGESRSGAAAWPAQKAFLEEQHTLIILCGASRARAVGERAGALWCLACSAASSIFLRHLVISHHHEALSLRTQLLISSVSRQNTLGSTTAS